MGEVNEVNMLQKTYYKESKGQAELVDKSLSELIHYFVSQNSEKTDEESKKLYRSL